MLITEHGRAAAILLDIGSYEELTKRADVLDRLIQLQFQITKAMTTIMVRCLQGHSTHARPEANPSH